MNRLHSGLDSHFYLYTDVGALKESEFLKVYPGWNVWQVWQVNELPFSVMMMGLDRDRQLRIWVEDVVRLGAPDASIADSLDLKGGQVQILNGAPPGLKTDQRKESVPGPAMVVSGPATLRTVRFFNRGNQTQIAWPHDESYLLERTFIPSPENPATNLPAPSTISETVVSGAGEPVKELLKSPALYVAGAVTLLYVFRKELFSNVRAKLRNIRHSRNRRATS